MIAILGLALACGVPAESGAGGRYLIVDTDAPRVDARPGADPLCGAIFAFDPATRKTTLFAQDDGFADPQAIVRHPDGSWLVLDFSAAPGDDAPDPAARGAIFRLDGATGRTLRRYDSALFRAPTSLTLLDDRTLLVSDRAALQDGARKGAVFALALDTGETRVLVAAPAFRAPSWLARDPAGTVLLLDADAKADPERPDEGIVFAIDAAAGTATPRLALEGGVSPLGFLPLGVDNLLIFDSNADPKRLGGPLGALFRARRDETGEFRTELVASIPRFRDPVRGCLGPDGRVWFVDANADPEKRGPDAAGRGQNLTGPGAIFTLDPADATIELVASPTEFVNPVAIAWDPR